MFFLKKLKTMHIIYFKSHLNKELILTDIKYILNYSELIYDEEVFLLTGYISINLSDLQSKKINKIINEISNLYIDILFNVDIENKEIHFINKSFHEFIEFNCINIIINDEKELSNNIYVKILEDYFCNFFKLKISHNNIFIENSNIECTYICEENNDNLQLYNYFTDEFIKNKIKRFYDFSISLKKKGFEFKENKFIKIK